MKNCLLSVIALLLVASPVYADTSSDLENMLHEFLAGATVGSAEAHRNFWADDLIYTSSSGTRTNKSEILGSMSPAAEQDELTDATPPAVVYSAEDIAINLYDDMAIVAFKLVGTPSDDTQATAYYFNTGTFVMRDGRWQVVAWQATRIPDDAVTP